MLLLLLACSPSSVDLNLAEVAPAATGKGQVSLGASTGTFTHEVALQLLFSGKGVNTQPGTRTLTLELSAAKVEFLKGSIAAQVPDAAFEVPLVITKASDMVAEAQVEVPLQLELDAATQRTLRARCNEAVLDWQLRGTWTTPGFSEGGWTVKQATGTLPLLLDDNQATLSCGLAKPDTTQPVVPLLRGTSSTQARVIGTFQGGHFDERGTVKAGSFRPVGLTSPEQPWTLTGELRSECDVRLARAKGSEAIPFLVGGSHPLQPRPVKELDATKSWTVDLDGDGVPETVVIVQNEMQEPEDLKVSAVSVRQGEFTDRVGFPFDTPPGAALISNKKHPYYTTLEGIADVDGDGRMELFISHHIPDLHFHEHVIYAWSKAGFWAMSTDVQTERDCYEDSDWKP